MPRPNILFVFADQLRRCSLGFGGDPNIVTPHFDRFAAGAVNFTQAISPVPVCCPARASLMTGLHPHHHGVVVNDVPLADCPWSMGHAFRHAGYDTAYIGKWHLDGQGRNTFVPPVRRQGFEHWWANECNHRYHESPYFAGSDPTPRQWRGYDAAAQTAKAIEFLEQDRTKPFLLMLSWGPPHNPYDSAPEQYRARVAAERLRLRPNVPADQSAQTQMELAGYYAHILALDDLFGDLLAALEARHLADDTLVVFWSDHGDMLHSQGEQRKQRPWEESIHVPLLLRWPGAGLTSRTATGLIETPDLLPTLMGLAGLPVGPEVDGVDLSVPLLANAPFERDAVVLRSYVPFGEYAPERGGREYRGVRTPRYTYVKDCGGPWLLYDNLHDPDQLVNLVGDAGSAEIQARLDELLGEKLVASDDGLLPGTSYLSKFGYALGRPDSPPLSAQPPSLLT